MTTKELISTCAREIKGTLDVYDVRNKVHGKIDEDLSLPNFASRVNGGIRISKKEEKKKRAWDLLDKDLSIVSKDQTAK